MKEHGTRASLAREIDLATFGNAGLTAGAKLASKFRSALPGSRTNPSNAEMVKLWPGNAGKLAECVEEISSAIAKGDPRLFAEIAAFLESAKPKGRTYTKGHQTLLFLKYVTANQKRILTQREITDYIFNERERDCSKETIRRFVRELCLKFSIPTSAKRGRPSPGRSAISMNQFGGFAFFDRQWNFLGLGTKLAIKDGGFLPKAEIVVRLEGPGAV